MVAVRAEIDRALLQANGNMPWVVREWAVRLKVSEYAIKAQRLWCCDHIVPAIENGSIFDLSNIQTLCIPCHVVKSNEEAHRRRHPGQLSLFAP
jgi:hypothetical protein